MLIISPLYINAAAKTFYHGSDSSKKKLEVAIAEAGTSTGGMAKIDGHMNKDAD